MTRQTPYTMSSSCTAASVSRPTSARIPSSSPPRTVPPTDRSGLTPVSERVVRCRYGPGMGLHAAYWRPDLAAWQPDDFGAAASVGTLLVACIATLIARRQLKQNRQLREEEAAPYIVVDILPGRVSPILLELVIENIGSTVAHDVRIRFDPPIQSAMDMSGYELIDWSPLKDGIETLVPGRRLIALFDSSFERHGTDLPRRYSVTINYMDSRRRKQPTLRHTVDLNPLYGALHSDPKGTHQLVQEVEKLRKAIEPISKKTLTVEVHDGKEARAERIERREEWQRQARLIEEREAAARQDAAAEDAPEDTEELGDLGPSGPT